MQTSDCPEYQRLRETLEQHKHDVNAFRDNKHPRHGKVKARHLAMAAQMKANDTAELLEGHRLTCSVCKADAHG
jgi:hypothetical protein